MSDVQRYGPQQGTMPILQFCAPAQLEVDSSYQRSTEAQTSRTLINRIARGWDWRLYQPLVVSRRPDGRLYVVDGQHRLEAARLRGDIAQLPAVIVEYGGPLTEAAAFVSINQERRPLSKLAVFRASVASGDTDAIAIHQLIAKAGFRLTGAADPKTWRPGWINNVVGIQQAYRRHGERVVRLALETMATAFAGQVQRYCGTVYNAIVGTVAQAEPNYIPYLLADILRDADQVGWMGRFREAATRSGASLDVAARELLIAAYNGADAQ